MSDKSEAFEKRAAAVTEKLLRSRESIVCIDSHTGGEPTRLVVGGMPEIKGDTITEKSRFFAENYDHLRTTLTAEPRGHKTMHAFILCPPTTDEADFGVVIACALGYLDMCGHGLIGAVASAIEAGIVRAEEPETRVVVETPAGLIVVRIRVSNGKAESVAFRNQPAFVYKRDLEVDVAPFGRFTVDIAFGGNWYVVVEAEKLGLEIDVKNLDRFSEANNRILETVNAVVSPEHPILGPGGKIPQMVFVGPPKNPEADSMNLVTSEALGYDRSPCGTGSSAKMAILHARGQLKLNQDYVHESGTTGSLFRSRLVEETKIGTFDAVIPEIEGSAYVTGINYIMTDPRDSLTHGFYVG
ncbi:MAG: proline racemase family protein [Deltaproteobacteria bacterium]|nr:proline racemase family protein [Deltaproteobacteria bacterium]